MTVIRTWGDTPDLDVEYKIWLSNSEILDLSHIRPDKRLSLIELLLKYISVFSDAPNRTNVIMHDVDVGNTRPIKQHPYQVNPIKLKKLRQEVQYMLDKDIIEPSQSSWASPCILVPKPDGSIRYCTDYRKVNALSKTDSFPIAKMEDCDLLKGYWCVPLTERTKETSAFVTPDGLYQYKVMSFGMKNSQATFQRLMTNMCLKDLEGVEVYVDDIVIFSDTWEEHLKRPEQVLFQLKEANLTVNLSKSDFVKAKVIYLVHVIGHGVVTPIKARVESIIDYPIKHYSVK